MLWLDPLVIILTDFATWKNIVRNTQKPPNIGKKKTMTLAFSLLQIDCYCFGFTMSLDKDQTRLSSVDLIGDIFPRRWVFCNKRTRVSIPLVGGAPTPLSHLPPPLPPPPTFFAGERMSAGLLLMGCHNFVVGLQTKNTYSYQRDSLITFLSFWLVRNYLTLWEKAPHWSLEKLHIIILG